MFVPRGRARRPLVRGLQGPLLSALAVPSALCTSIFFAAWSQLPFQTRAAQTRLARLAMGSRGAAGSVDSCDKGKGKDASAAGPWATGAQKLAAIDFPAHQRKVFIDLLQTQVDKATAAFEATSKQVAAAAQAEPLANITKVTEQLSTRQ
eukprot:4842136-Pyramimonas_sp.AAC.1